MIADTKENEIIREIKMTNQFLYKILQKLDDVLLEVKK